MPNTLSVTLHTSSNPWLVDVDEKNNANHVPRSNQAQTITWQLNGNAASGNITAFSWINPPPDGVFGQPQIAANGNSMTMSDNNSSASTSGDWIYQLTIEVGGNSYSTAVGTITGTTTNPTIKNN